MYLYFDNVFFHYIYDVCACVCICGFRIQCCSFENRVSSKCLKLRYPRTVPQNCIWLFLILSIFGLSWIVCSSTRSHCHFLRYINFIVNGLFMVIRSIPFLTNQTIFIFANKTKQNERKIVMDLQNTFIGYVRCPSTALSTVEYEPVHENCKATKQSEGKEHVW